MTTVQMRAATIGAVLSLILGIVDSNVVATAAWPIAKSLDPVHGLEHFPWLITAYGLAATVTQPLYGKLCDLYNPKRVYLFALATFLIGSALCGVAQNMGELIAFRGLQGVGGGGLMGVTLVVVLSIWPPKEATEGGGGGRGGAGAGMGGVMAGIGMVVGPLLGGYLTDHYSWRWIFYINLPLGLISWLLAAFFLHLPDKSSTDKLDYAGAGLIAAAASALLLVTEWGGQRYGWGSWQILALVVGGGVLLAAFLVRQGILPRGLWGRLAAPEPLFPLSLFQNKVFRIASPQEFLSGMVTTGGAIYVSLYLQTAKGVSPTKAGLHLIPMAVGMAITAIVSGRLVAGSGRYKPIMITGMATVTTAMGLLSLLRTHSGSWELSLFLFLLGAGLGQVLGLALTAVQVTSPKEQMGVAITSVRFSQTLGGAVGSSVFGAILARAYTAHLPDALKAGSHGGPSAAQIQAVPPAARPKVIDAIVSAADTVFLCGMGIAALALVLLFFLPEVKRMARAAAGGGAIDGLGPRDVVEADGATGTAGPNGTAPASGGLNGPRATAADATEVAEAGGSAAL